MRSLGGRHIVSNSLQAGDISKPQLSQQKLSCEILHLFAICFETEGPTQLLDFARLNRRIGIVLLLRKQFLNMRQLQASQRYTR
jgi:hypothetical protein